MAQIIYMDGGTEAQVPDDAKTSAEGIAWTDEADDGGSAWFVPWSAVKKFQTSAPAKPMFASV
jgi:hypothetical protein